MVNKNIYLIIKFETSTGGGIGFILENEYNCSLHPEKLMYIGDEYHKKQCNFHWPEVGYHEVIGKTTDINLKHLRTDNNIFYYHGGDCC